MSRVNSGLVQFTDSTINLEIYNADDDDSEGILKEGSYLISLLKSGPELLAASIHIAEKNEMID